jgi:hypothetical protein
MNVDFNDLPWHDAILRSIYVDRNNPGERDVVKLLINWPDEETTSNLEFGDCYGLTANMNFGVVASESILMAECVDDCDELRSMRQEWSNGGVNLDQLKCYKITTNSTNSSISIFALHFKLEKDK